MLTLILSAESAASKSHVSAESSAFMVCDVAETQTFSDCCTTQDPVSCREVSVSNKPEEVQLETKVKTCTVTELILVQLLVLINWAVYDQCQVDGAFSEFEVLDVVSEATILSGMRTIT